jgi:hypothetical protein
MSNPHDQAVRDGTNQYSLYFVIAGVSVGFSTFLQVSQQKPSFCKVSDSPMRHINIFNTSQCSLVYNSVSLQERNLLYLP